VQSELLRALPQTLRRGFYAVRQKFADPLPVGELLEERQDGVVVTPVELQAARVLLL
jgi:hypothetical protein